MKKTTLAAKRLLLCALAGAMLLCSGCALTETERMYIDLFDTVSRAVTVDGEANAEANAALLNDVHALLYEYHRLCDIYNEYDGIINACTLNKTAMLAPVRADARLIELLEYAVEMHALTGGRVNVAMGAVLSLWHDSRAKALEHPEAAALPDPAQLQLAAQHTNIEDLIIDAAAGTVYYRDPLLRLDLGAVAKGYAAQRALELMAASAPRGALLALGGNVCTLGVREDGRPWRVAVQDPFSAETLCTLNVSGLSVVTSGVYERYFEVNGARYHHIIDPATLMPSAYYASVTVVCGDSALADALSTALFNMPPADALAFAAALEDVEVFFVLPDGAQLFSDGFHAYLD